MAIELPACRTGEEAAQQDKNDAAELMQIDLYEVIDCLERKGQAYLPESVVLSEAT